MNREHERSAGAGWPQSQGGGIGDEACVQALGMADNMVPSVARLSISPATTDGVCLPGDTCGEAP